MALLKRAKPPSLPDVHDYGTGNLPPLGANPASLDWLWSAISAGMVTGVAPLSTKPVTESEVLGIPAVSASLSLLTTFALQMPLEAVRENITPPEVVEPTPPIIRGPLGDPRVTGLTLADWIEGFIRDLALYGNYLAVLGDFAWDGWPVVMYPVPAGEWSVYTEHGVRWYDIGGDVYNAAEIFHVAINRCTGELVGRGLLSNPDAILAAIMAERWAARYFETGTTPSVHISHPNPDLTQQQAEDLKAKFVASTQGKRAPVITPVGTEITVLPNDAESAQLVEARKWSAQAMCVALGVPPAMLGIEAASMTYRNLSEVNQQMVSATEMRYLVPVEQQLTAQTLPRGIRARFNALGLVRPDYAERMTQALAGFAGGLLTNAEARAMIDLAPSTELEDAQSEPAPAEVLPPAPDPNVMPAQQLVAIGGGAQDG